MSRALVGTKWVTIEWVGKICTRWSYCKGEKVSRLQCFLYITDRGNRSENQSSQSQRDYVSKPQAYSAIIMTSKFNQHNKHLHFCLVYLWISISVLSKRNLLIVKNSLHSSKNYLLASPILKAQILKNKPRSILCMERTCTIIQQSA